MDGTTTPRGARTIRTTDPHPRTPTTGLDLASHRAALPHDGGAHETRLPAGTGRRPNGSWTGVANPNRVRLGSDGDPGTRR